MAVVGTHKFIKQTKVLRLACYRAFKYAGTPAAECVYGFTEINERCQNCVWFKVVDETRKVRTLLQEVELNPDQAISTTLKDLPPPALEHLP